MAESGYISCWHLSEVESAHLWSAYTAQGEGVAIQSTVGRLRSVLSEYKAKVTIAPVRYVDYTTYQIGPSPEQAAFYKRKSFSAEQELRVRYSLSWEFCMYQKDGENYWAPPEGINLKIDCSELIERIYISPALGDWFCEAVSRLLRNFGIEREVVKSSISDPKIL